VSNAASEWAQRALGTPVEVFAALREWKNNFR
jgi:hydroxyacylglutathione hydrolase